MATALKTGSLTVEERKTLMKETGVSMAELRALSAEGYTYAEIKDLCETERDAKIAAKTREAEIAADATKQALEQQHRKEHPDNPDPPKISAFNPLGERDHPRPKMKRKAFDNGTPYDWEAMSREEIEAVNAVSDLLPGPGSKRTGADLRASGGNDYTSYVVSVSANGDEIHFRFPAKTIEDRAKLPSSVRMLCSLFMDGVPVVNPDQMLDIITAQNARIAALEAAAAR